MKFNNYYCRIFALIFFVGLSSCCADSEIPVTGVEFNTTCKLLQKLYDAAEKTAEENIVQFTPKHKILVEGGGYNNAWLETQPMGGAMYAKRNLRVGLNNQLIFMMTQRDDGRLPGMVVSHINSADGWQKSVPYYSVAFPKIRLCGDYRMLQGFCFPMPAYEIYFLAGKDRQYLLRLYKALQAYDAYLWHTRDSDDNGVLEAWCAWDTGEDCSSRFAGAPDAWPYDYPPAGANTPDPMDAQHRKEYWPQQDKDANLSKGKIPVPYESMDVMAYSYQGRDVLAKISGRLNNGKQKYWRQKAEDVRKRLIEYLWRPDKHACYDRDKNNKFMESLIHNNLRCMWYGIFTQQMADEFIQYHLLNPNEFWTPMPLPSIAANDSLFRNITINNWSGQSEGLTYQRAIRALENYGHFAELTMLGHKLIDNLSQRNTFAQQYDPFTGQPGSQVKDIVQTNYGPTILAVLEYISRMYGIHIVEEKIWWSGLQRADHSISYTQKYGNKRFTIDNKNGMFKGLIDGVVKFTCTTGVRIETDMNGQVLRVIGIATVPRNVVLKAGSSKYRFTVRPNTVYRLDKNGKDNQPTEAVFF